MTPMRPTTDPPSPFHSHLDVCKRCRERPFNLCPDGERILKAEIDTLQMPGFFRGPEFR